MGCRKASNSIEDVVSFDERKQVVQEQTNRRFKLYKSKQTEDFITENLRPLVREHNYFVKIGSLGGSMNSEAQKARSKKAAWLGGDDSAFKSDLETPLREALNGISLLFPS